MVRLCTAFFRIHSHCVTKDTYPNFKDKEISRSTVYCFNRIFSTSPVLRFICNWQTCCKYLSWWICHAIKIDSKLIFSASEVCRRWLIVAHSSSYIAVFCFCFPAANTFLQFFTNVSCQPVLLKINCVLSAIILVLIVLTVISFSYQIIRLEHANFVTYLPCLVLVLRVILDVNLSCKSSRLYAVLDCIK